MNKTQKTIALAISSAFAIAAVEASHATDNPFTLKTFSQGYTVADNHDGKCNTGSCGNKSKKSKSHKKDKKDNMNEEMGDKKDAPPVQDSSSMDNMKDSPK